MWKQKDLKRAARAGIRRNYLNAVAVCLVMAFFAGAYTTMFSGSEQSTLDAISLRGASNSEIARALIAEITGQLTRTGGTPMTGATRGVLAAVFNNSTQAGSFIFGVLNSINQLLFHDRIVAGVIILAGSVFSFLYWLFVGNVLRVGECRFYLETRHYPSSSPNRLFFIYRVRRTNEVALAMFLRALYTLLWSLTIVGGPIKHYTYWMVPYILAENPGIAPREALRLSSELMRGRRWRAFLLDLSFLHWELLSLSSFGLAGYLYGNPYLAATKAELYTRLRQEAMERENPRAGLFNDAYLYAPPPGEPAEKYPVALFSLPEHPGRRWLTEDYHRDYSLLSLIFLFFSYCLIGWLWETFFYLFSQGGFSNPGFLHGPWLPIYGSGGVLMLVLLKKWRDRPVVQFFLIMLLAGVIEYFTGWYLEAFKGATWWDYSGYLFNIQGRVCLEGLIVFGVFGSVSIYFLAPVLDGFFSKIPRRAALPLAAVLVFLFSADLLYSSRSPNIAEGITKEVPVFSAEEP